MGLWSYRPERSTTPRRHLIAWGSYLERSNGPGIADRYGIVRRAAVAQRTVAPLADDRRAGCVRRDDLHAPLRRRLRDERRWDVLLDARVAADRAAARRDRAAAGDATRAAGERDAAVAICARRVDR